MVKYAPRKVYIRESGGYVELSYTEFCRCRESDQTYIPTLYLLLKQWYLMTMGSQSSNAQQRLRQWNTS